MYVNWQTLITIGGGVSAISLLIGFIIKAHNLILWVKENKKEIEKVRAESEERYSKLQKHHDDDMRRINDENCLVCFALSACLDGLQQLGAKNNEVPEAKKRLDKYLNQQAHE